MNYWWTSDPHFGHANIISYCSRPWLKDGDLDSEGRWISQEIAQARLDKMNEALVHNWNERVSTEDTVIVAGDFCFKGGKEGGGSKASYWEKKLNGKLIFIKGNHDCNNSCKAIIQRAVVDFGGKRICVVHNPHFVDTSYKINFVGHVHDKWQIKRIKSAFGFTDAINIGMDVWNYRPISWNEIMGRYYRWLNQHYYEATQ